MMWKRPWGAGEGISICCGLIVIGLAMQVATGSIVWENFAAPVNAFLLAVYIVIILLLYLLRNKIYFIRWAMTYKAAVPALAFVAFMTFLMGMIKQDPNATNALRRMLSFTPFVLVYCWMTTILGLTVLKQLFSFKIRRIPSLFNHLGLFVALVCATLGSADMQRLTMNVQVGRPEWRATNSNGELKELPLAIELEEFTIEEYAPKLMLIDNETGKALPESRPEQLMMEEGVTQGKLSGWDIKIKDYIEYAASAASNDTIRYVEWRSMGATNAAYIEATRIDGSETHEGWVSCGSFAFPYQALRLDSLTSIVMPDREPRKFTSQVKIYTQSGTTTETSIEVNKPAEIEGWKIYQLSYDQTKGRWSDVSVFELVIDPWLPAVYAGIFLMIGGAILMFITANSSRNKPREEERE